MDQPNLDSPIRILVVDDHPNTAITLARAIARLGPVVKVISATSGREALSHVREEAVDILLTDMIMPEMTGLELIEQLQNHPSGRPTYCFLMTAYEVPGLKVTAQRLKVKEVIIKPIHPERICQIVKQALEEMNQVKPSRAKSGSRKPFTILIADDKPDNLTLLSRYLEHEGYGYIKASDGLETLEKVRSASPDLVMLDINMPYKDGFTVLKEIRADPATEHIPVIILTAARLESTDIQSGLNMGADDYVTKPFDRRELLARIRTKLRVKEAEDAIRRRNTELNLLPEIGRELSARLNLEDLSNILLKRTVETLGAMFGHIFILDGTRTYQKTYHLDPALSVSDFTIPGGLLEILRETRQGFIVSDTRSDPRWQASRGDSARSAVVVPLFGRYDLLGILVLTNEQMDYFTLDHLLLLQAISSQASIAIENARLYDKMSHEQQRLDAVLQSAADAILVFDAQACLTLVNPAGRRLFTDYEAKIGQPLPCGAGYESFLKLLEQARLSDASFSGEVVWPDQRVFSALMTPIPEGGIVVVMHDVTRFKELERVKDQFIATASHDLRNPITSIKGYSQLVRQAGPLNDNQDEFIKRIQHATENMNYLVENMLDLAKMDLGAVQINEVLDMTTLLREMADEFGPEARTKGQSLILGRVDAAARVRGDALKLRQALRNLIANAIKYTPEGGTITLDAECDHDLVNVKVTDTGLGIPADDLPHIFERFYRARNNEQDQIQGNGLGLAIVKSITEGHGGQISTQSEPGKGSCFTVSLPLLQTEMVASPIQKQDLVN